MANSNAVTAEASGAKVAAIFPTEERAREVAAQLRTDLALGDLQVRVVTPNDRQPGRKLEPEGQGIFRTMIRAHARLGVIGALAGAVLFGVFWFAGAGMVVNAAAPAAFAMIVIGGLVGLMAGGLVTLRPDHDSYINRVFEAIGEGQCAVVVHALSEQQQASASEQLAEAGGEVVSTLPG